MKKLVLCALILPLFALTACKVQKQVTTGGEAQETITVDLNKMMDGEAVEEQNDEMMGGDSAMDSAQPVGAAEEEGGAQAAQGERHMYAAYSEGVIGNGEGAILFFAASWCPICNKHDKALQSWYASNEFPISTYRVDFDAALELKKRYGVVQQHTFVRIDAEGNAVKTVSGPTDEMLLDLIRI